jgi:serine/threonine protein kinase
MNTNPLYSSSVRELNISDNEIKLRTIVSTLVEDFKKQYSSKDTFESDMALGYGAYGVVYKAKDNARDLEVVIKFYHKGAIPEGSERGWNLSSKTINRQIAPTYTIESFLSGQYRRLTLNSV